jgi:ribonuclease HII
MRKKYKYLIGIDEAGRGPLAGPVAVAAVIATLRTSQGLPFGNSSRVVLWEFVGIKDSKKLSVKKREEWYKKIKSHPLIGGLNLKSELAFVSPKTIDKIGISKALMIAVKRTIKKLEKTAKINPRNCFVLLDGSLRAPKEYEQKTIIKGDEKIPLISAASIIAKVARDKKMTRLHKKFPAYCFDKHKGYGTKLHYKMLKKHGISKEHRKSFCKSIK